ncbi:MAG: hypothetical protein SOT71_08230 [Romboutsia timonensis]|uniref:hypothetical protein n=1 Tax=Romboutsia timonensis TaxID=1776391 RepID=UPI002A74EC11|nr:hypothetical protein [Romboutsia timonensis]MDY2882626.1 hypothetical protein [Romboutsia timonensis]
MKIIKLKNRNKMDVIKNIIFADNILKIVVLKNYSQLEKKLLHQKIYEPDYKNFVNPKDTIKIVLRNSILSLEEKRYLYALLYNYNY